MKTVLLILSQFSISLCGINIFAERSSTPCLTKRQHTFCLLYARLGFIERKLSALGRIEQLESILYRFYALHDLNPLIWRVLLISLNKERFSSSRIFKRLQQ